MPRTYVDNAYNRRVGRVGLPVGSAVISKNTVCGMNTKTYVDNAYNRQLGRVGMPHGSAVVSKYSDGLTTWNYLNTDRQDRQVCPPEIKSSFTPKYTEHTSEPCKDVKHAWRQSDNACFYPQDTPRNRVNVPNSRERWRSNGSSSESSSDMDKLVREMTAAQTIVEELNQTESEIAVTSPFMSNLQDRDIHELMRCRVCHTDMDSSSLTPCGHHFCTHCILQWLERKQSCPICRTRLRESNLIQDTEFDRIIGHFAKRPLQTTDTVGSIRYQEIGQYKEEIKQLKTQIQELKENKERQEANRQKTEHRYLQLATQLKEKTEQIQKLTDELDKVRKKDIALQKQIDTNVRQCDDHLQELYELKENVLPERERTVARLQNQLKERTTASSDTEQAVRILKNEIGQQEYRMKEYENLCAEKDEELTVLRKFVIPERESIIFQLQRQCKQLSVLIGQHGRHTLSEEEMAAIQQLQNYYDKEFSRKFAITESMIHALRDKTDQVVDIFSTRKDQKDGLPDFVRKYTSLIKENSSLHQTAIKHEEELNRMKRELRHCKARTHELERKYQLERTLPLHFFNTICITDTVPVVKRGQQIHRPEQFLAAKSLVDRDGYSIRKAAYETEIPYQTLRDHLNGRYTDKVTTFGSRRLLMAEHGSSLSNYCKYMLSRGVPLSRQVVKHLARDIIHQEGGGDVVLSDKWLLCYQNRHPELSFRTAHPLQQDRAAVTQDTVDHYFDLLEETLTKLNIIHEPAHIFNCDESWFSGWPNPSKKVITSKGTRCADQSIVNMSGHITILNAISPIGQTLLPMLIYSQCPSRSYTDALLPSSTEGDVKKPHRSATENHEVDQCYHCGSSKENPLVKMGLVAHEFVNILLKPPSTVPIKKSKGKRSFTQARSVLSEPEKKTTKHTPVVQEVTVQPTSADDTDDTALSIVCMVGSREGYYWIGYDTCDKWYHYECLPNYVQKRPYEGLVTLCLEFLWAARQVPLRQARLLFAFLAVLATWVFMESCCQAGVLGDLLIADVVGFIAGSSCPPECPLLSSGEAFGFPGYPRLVVARGCHFGRNMGRKVPESCPQGVDASIVYEPQSTSGRLMSPTNQMVEVSISILKMSRTYVDNAYNRRHGRVGLPVGSAVISKNTVCGINTKTYADNPYNMQLGRVGMSHGSAVVSKYSDGLTTWNYLNTDRQDRQVCPPGIKSSFTPNAYFYPQDIPRIMVNVPNGLERWRSNSSSGESSTDMDKLVRERTNVPNSDGLTTWNYLNTDRQDRQVCPPGIKSPFTPKYTESTSDPCKDVEHAWRESDNAYFYPQDIPRNMVNVPNSWERWRSNSSSSESSTDMDKLVREMTAAQTIVEELNQTELEIAVTSPFTSNLQDGDIHELMRCRICHKDMESSSLTPCGHHFCTHCILQWLERKQSCPICRTRFRESNLIQDEEFDRIIGHFAKRPLQTTDTVGSTRNQEIGQYKQEIKQLKTQIQELKENKERQEANRQKTEHRYLQLATQLKKKTEQNQKLTYELDKIRKKDIALQKQIDTNVRQCDDHLQELYELKENVLPERERTVARLQNQPKERTSKQVWALRMGVGLGRAASSDTEQAVRILKNEIGQQEYRMKEYENLCAEKDEELTVLRKFVIPERESIIFKLQRQCKQLSVLIGQHGRHTLSEEEMTAIQQLQNYYDKEFSRKFAITESMMHALRDKTDQVLDILSTRKDQKDGLPDFVRNYTSLIKENSSLHQTAIKHEEELNRMKRELHHSKARTHELERKYQLERTFGYDEIPSVTMPRTYVDNAYNRSVGRAGLPVGSAVISKNTVCGMNTKTYVDNAYNRQLGRVGMSHGSAVVSKYSDGLTTSRTNHYVDNAYNRRHGRVGLPVGSAVISKNTVCGINTNTYVDNAYNRQHGRVGMPHGSAVISKYSDGLTTWNYLDTDTRDSSLGINTPKAEYTEHTSERSKDETNAWKESDIAGPHLRDTSRNKANVAKSSERGRSSIREFESSADVVNVAEVQDTNQQKHEERYLQLAKHFKEKTEQNQKLTDELNKIRKKNSLLQQKVDINLKQCVEYQQELHEVKENVLPERERLIVQLRNQLKKGRENELEFTHQMQKLQEEIDNKSGQNQKLDDELYEAKLEVSRLKDEVEHLQVYAQRCCDQDRQLHDYRENILPEKENIIANLSTQIVQLSNHLNEKENEVVYLNDQIQQLQKYVQICYDLNGKLTDLHENILPEKDGAISVLQSHVEKLFDDITTLKRTAVSVSQLEVLPETNLSRAIQQLQHFYDREYRSRYDITDKMEALLQTRLECVMSELCKQQEIGDRLALVINTYTSMVKENSNLHRSLRTKEGEIKQLKAELRKTKVTKLEIERRVKHMSEE
ncbi:uncharacterized protein LOC123559949 [Mercenaria mercenaria]|uniref:uncharacterized protein LOC123559949 n=1 Tax=Mercenaria mercenaria TaxID=6596 RepID=UPI00234F5FBF|nr:uncharacterized protein LOC123559949 [Mercenaria mercenaria]